MLEQRQSYHHKDLRKALIETGIELVSKEGVSAFSLRKVAAACGVSHAAPYSHFQNKEELLKESRKDKSKKMLEVKELLRALCVCVTLHIKEKKKNMRW